MSAETTAARRHTLQQRLAAHRLDHPARRVSDVGPLLCGLQDSDDGTAPTSLALRWGGADAVEAAIEDGSLVTAMSLRGTPHLHRADQLEKVRAAMTMTSRRDLQSVCGDLSDEVATHDDPVGEVARAAGRAIGAEEGMSKTDLSTAVTPLLPTDLAPYCTPCGVHHAIDGLFRLATLRAWLVLVPGTRTQTFRRFDNVGGAGKPPARAVTEARTELAQSAAQLAEPADRGQLGSWLGWHPRSVDDALGGDRQPKTSPRGRPGRRARLLPARDPWLRGSNRAWLLGEHTDRRSEVFRSLGAPGVVVVDGELVGVWRHRKKDKTLSVEVELWGPTSHQDELEADAQVAAQVRDLTLAMTIR